MSPWNRTLNYWYQLYANPTVSEDSLEPAIATLGERYRAQHLFPGQHCIADFALLDRQVVIEVDGASHNRPDQKEKDLEHMIALQAKGWVVVRVTNEQAQADPAGTVLAALERAETLRKSPPDYQALLADLRARYPRLADAAAKKAMKTAQRQKAARDRVARRRAARSQSKREAQPRGRRSPRPT